ncbi:MAG: hypothetical protein ABSE89_02040 [Sedimentisphaerales bacterium]
MLRPESVKQMIQVLIRFKDKYTRYNNIDKAHREAVDEVAQQWQIGRTGIHDMCLRRLKLTNIANFRNLLEKWMLGDSAPLLQLLCKFTPSYFYAEIENVLTKDKTNLASLLPKTHTTFSKVVQRLDKSFNFSIDPDTAKKLKVLSVMEDISTSESESDWLRKIVTEVVNKRYADWLNIQSQNKN